MSSTWTIVFDDKKVVKNNGAESGTGHHIDDDAFWLQSKFSNIWAIQYEVDPKIYEVEYRDGQAHTTYADANLGDFSEVITRWDNAHLKYLQDTWDNNVLQVATDEKDESNHTIYRDETNEEKIIRIGERPTSYSSNG